MTWKTGIISIPADKDRCGISIQICYNILSKMFTFQQKFYKILKETEKCDLYNRNERKHCNCFEGIQMLNLTEIFKQPL